MTISRRRFITITAATTAYGLTVSRLAAQPGGPAQITRWRGVALGAGADIRLVGLDTGRAAEQLDRVKAEIARLERIFSLYLPDSELARLNARGELTAPTPELVSLLSTVSFVHRLTDGAFDPTVQPLWDAYARTGGRPDDDSLARARRVVGWQRVVVSPEAVRLPAGGGLTLNGIAQGYITDKVVAMLRAAGLEKALVEVGEIAAIGAPNGTAGWPVRLRSAAGPAIAVRDRAVATSAPTATRFDDGGSHIIDPRTGSPVRSHWVGASVVHRTAAMADALSTAAVAMDIDGVRSMIARLDNTAFHGLHARRGPVTLAG